MFMTILRTTPEAIHVYWILARIIIPVTVVTEFLSRMGAIEAMAPVFAPVMDIVGLPPELGLAFLTAMLVGIWGAVPLIFALVPVSELSVADVTIFSTLVLFAHGFPIEQKIIQKAGPGIIATTLLRVAGGLFYAFILHHIFSATGWLQEPVQPTWIPLSATSDWSEFIVGFAGTMIWMLIILVFLCWILEFLKLTGAFNWMMTAIAPVLRCAGIKGEAGHFTSVGLFLGISYGAGLLIREVQSGSISPRQVFLSCALMGFTHSIIEDTVLVAALGADVWSVLAGRLLFTLCATAGLAAILPHIPDRVFFKYMFHLRSSKASMNQNTSGGFQT